MATKILDSWALMALFNGEPAADEVEELLAQAAADRHKLLMSVVNWGEIYYSVMRGATPAMAEQKAREIAAMPVEIVPADLPLTQRAAIFKPPTKCPTPTASPPRWPKNGKPNSSPATRNSGNCARRLRFIG